MNFYYKTPILQGIISKLYNIQGTITINDTTIGNKIVQQNDISWSYLILGKDALTQINTKTIAHVFNPKLKL